MKKYVNGFIIVEGQSDINFLSSFLETEVIQVGGNALPRGTLDYILALSKLYPSIILTDPDNAGVNIAKRLKTILVDASVVTIPIPQGRRHKKGVAEAEIDDVLKALEPYIISYNIFKKGSLTMNDLIKLNILNKEVRDDLSLHFHLGACNQKTFLKRLNILNITYNEIKDYINK